MNNNISQYEILNIIKRISAAVTEDTIKLLTASAVELAGGEFFIYSTIRENRNTQLHDIHHHFENCSKEWRLIYDQRKWFMNDPFIEYARSHTEPALNSTIIPITSGQSDMLRAAALHGFRSGIVIPAHSNLGAQQCLGMLLVGASTEPERSDANFLSNRVVFRALAMELMDWWKNQFQQRAIQRFKIQQREVLILEHLNSGKTISEIAAITDAKASTVYRHLDVLKDKLNALKTEDLIQKAKFVGLFG